jgi:hypothetical protein
VGECGLDYCKNFDESNDVDEPLATRCFFLLLEDVEVSIVMEVPRKIAGWFISWKALLKWMIWGYPYFRTPPCTNIYPKMACRSMSQHHATMDQKNGFQLANCWILRTTMGDWTVRFLLRFPEVVWNGPFWGKERSPQRVAKLQCSQNSVEFILMGTPRGYRPSRYDVDAILSWKPCMPALWRVPEMGFWVVKNCWCKVLVYSGWIKSLDVFG